MKDIVKHLIPAMIIGALGTAYMIGYWRGAKMATKVMSDHFKKMP